MKERGIHYKQVQKAIDRLDFEYLEITPRACVIGIDTTYFGRDFGVVIFKDLTNKVVLHWCFVQHEHIDSYRAGIGYLKKRGVTPMGYVVDGFWPFFVYYGGSNKIQMCNKHMKDIVRRYLTLNPKLEASKELKMITDRLCIITEKEFNFLYSNWLIKWESFLKEKTYLQGTKQWEYTHQRLRSAVHSLNKYKRFLFTYQHHKFIPNTNNSVEGTNSALKSFIKLHKGLRPDRKAKLIHYYLKEKSKFKWGN